MAEELTNKFYFTKKEEKPQNLWKGFYRQTVSKHNHTPETLDGLGMQGVVGVYPRLQMLWALAIILARQACPSSHQLQDI